MCKCLVSGKELPDANVNLAGYECRESGRYTCPNFMHRMVNGKNCRLLQNNEKLFAKLSLTAVKEPYKELYRNKSLEELKEMYSEFKTKYKESFEPRARVLLRSQLGAIEELLEERGA